MDLFVKESDLSKKAHYIYFYNDMSKRTAEWDMMRYISVKSFAVNNPEYEVNFYTNKKPEGEYWERASDYCKLQVVEPEREIYGRPLLHPAHVSDVFRIRLLDEHGGVYQDFDTITVKCFDDLLKKNVFIVGDMSYLKKTMGNGVIVSPKKSPYLQEWLEMWKEFRSTGLDKYWDELSVKAHRTLTTNPKLRGTFEILPSKYFYPYSHYRTRELFDEYNPLMVEPETYSVHLYDSQNYKKVNLYTEKEITQNPERSSHTWLINRFL